MVPTTKTIQAIPLDEHLKGDGRSGEIEQIYLRELHVKETALGAKHVAVIPICHNLAQLCVSQGRYADARSYLERCLHVIELAKGADHVEVAHWLTLMGEFFLRFGKYQEAEPVFWRALAIHEKCLNIPHAALDAHDEPTVTHTPAPITITTTAAAATSSSPGNCRAVCGTSAAIRKGGCCSAEMKQFYGQQKRCPCAPEWQWGDVPHAGISLLQLMCEVACVFVC